MPPKKLTKKVPRKVGKAKVTQSRDDNENSTSCDSQSEEPSDADDTDLSCIMDDDNMEGMMKLLGMLGMP